MKNEPTKPVIFVFSTAYLPFIGGAEVAIEQVAKRLKEKFCFVIFTSRMRRDLPKREVRDEGLVVRVGFGNRFDKFWLLVFGLLTAWREFKKQRRKVLFWVMDFSFGAAAAGFLKIVYPKIPLIFTMQYGYGDERIAKGRAGLMRLAFRLILARADYVTAISRYLLELCKKYGFIGEGAVIHNGVDVQKFKITKHKLQTNSNTVITVGRLVPKNGIDVLIKAVAELKRQLPMSNIQLRIVGDGPERKNLERITGGLGLMADVKFFGDIPYDELPKYWAEADVFARPSRSEGMGNSFVEALAAGLPIVGTPVGGILDIIKDPSTSSGQATGLFARVDDPKDLAEKIKVLLRDKALAETIVENGRKMVKEKFSWDKIAERYTGVFAHELWVKKRILIATGIFPPEVGGPATYSKILLDDLPKQGLGVKVSTYGESKIFPWFIRHAIFGIKTFFMARNCDVLYAQDAVNSGVVCVISAFVWRKKFILKIVGDYAWEQGVQRFGVKEVLDDFLNNKYRWEVELLRKIQKFVANRADKIIVPSEYLKVAVERWGVKSKKIQVIYNAFEVPNLSMVKSEARNKLGLNQNDKIIISAGRQVPWKGFETLREIMPEIARKFPETKLFILTDELREKLLLYLISADVFVLNTAYEGFSHQILEAMSLGVPVVTADSGGNPELIEDGKSGFLVKFNDKKALVEKISQLLSDKNLADLFAEKAKKKAQEFSKERMISATIRALS